KVVGITLTLTNPTKDDNFGAFSSCEAGIASNTKPEYKVFASLPSNADAYAASLVIPVSDIDLKDYFSSTVLIYKVTGTSRRATTTTLKGKAKIQFDIEAGL